MIITVHYELDWRLVLQPSPWVTLLSFPLLLSMYKSDLLFLTLNLDLLCYCLFHCSIKPALTCPLSSHP